MKTTQDIFPTFNKKEHKEILMNSFFAPLGNTFSYRGKMKTIKSTADCRDMTLMRLLRSKGCLNLRGR